MEPEIYPLENLPLGGVTWHVARDSLDRITDWLLNQFIDVLDNNQNLLKDGGGSRVGASDGLVIKESTVRQGRSVVRFGLKPSSSRRAFTFANELISQGVPTPRPLAWATVRYYGLRAKDYLITEELTNARPLTHYLKTVNLSEERNRIARLLGELLARFHVAGFSNRDMKDSNILVAEDLKLWAVDMEGVAKKGRISAKRAMRDMWAIVRSFRVYGWEDETNRIALIEGYNSEISSLLSMKSLPEEGAGVIAREDA